MGNKGLSRRILKAMFFFLICIAVISVIAFVLDRDVLLMGGVF